MTSTEEMTDQVEKAHDHAVFNMAVYLRNGGVILPTDQVDVMTDVEAGYEIGKIEIEMDELTQQHKDSMAGVPQEEMDALEARKEVLAQRLWASRSTFYMRGVAPYAIAAMNRKIRAEAGKHKWDDHTIMEHSDMEILRKTIYKIQVGDQEDTHVITNEEIFQIMDSLPYQEQEKIRNMATMLNYGVVLADKRADAGFPGGSPDVAAEL